MDLDALGPWLHNIHLPDGRQTAPRHALGDWPRSLWRSFAHAFDEDLSGMRVLDIGCNAGFYSFEMAKRDADVVGIDMNPRYLRQARALAEELGLSDRTDFRNAQVYDLARWDEEFDIVLFLGVFYHLRYPLLGLDIAARRCRGRMVFQTLMQGPPVDRPVEAPAQQVGQDMPFLTEDDWPKMAFIEGELFGDPTNWWVPHGNAVAPMLRSAGFTVDEVAGGHVFLCSLAPDAQERRASNARELASATGTAWRGGMDEHLAPAAGTLESQLRAP